MSGAKDGKKISCPAISQKESPFWPWQDAQIGNLSPMPGAGTIQ